VFIVVVRLIGPRSGDADSLFRSPTDLGWPRGVQEEEPVRWRVESLGRRRRVDVRPDMPASTRLEVPGEERNHWRRTRVDGHRDAGRVA
jgi:hypothetical protein